MIKFFHKNEVIVVFSILTFAFCQIFFRAYFDQIDDFTKSKNNAIYNIELHKQQDEYTANLIKNYAVEFLDKVAPNSHKAENFVVMLNDKEYGTKYVDIEDEELYGELYGVVGDVPLEELYPEISYALELDTEFKRLVENYPGINNIYYASKNNFIYKWPKTSYSSARSYTADDIVNDDAFTQLQEVAKYGEENIKIVISIFDKMDNYYGVLAYEFNNKDRYSFLDDQFPRIIRDEKDEIIYTNIEDPEKNSDEIKEAIKTFDGMGKIKNEGELFSEGSRYYSVYSFLDGTDLLQYLEVSTVFYEATKVAFPIILIGICYIAFLLLQKNMEKTSNELAETIEELSESHAKLEELANKDFLTGIYNRAGFNKVITEYVKADKNMTFVMIDIDKFKSINDTYGHEIGDVVLKTVSSVIQSSLDDLDEVGRWGGEEFLAVFTGVSEQVAFNKAEEIRKKILEIEIPADNDRIVKASASFGVSRYIRNSDPIVTIGEADEALYYSKNNGRNQVNRYSQIKDLINS